MASWTPLALILMMLSVHMLAIKSSAQAGGKTAVYWGQNNQDGDLSTTCDSKLYDIVVLGFLTNFGSGNAPILTMKKCTSSTSCTNLQADIRRCQNQGVKVYLSLGGPTGPYSFSDTTDAETVAQWLYTNFLSNNNGPLGIVILDGFDLRIESPGASSNQYWDIFARALDNIRQRQSPALALSASPHCSYPDNYLDAAIQTNVFNQLFVQFYNDARCQYSSANPDSLKSSWNQWTMAVSSSTKVFFNLPASSAAAPGYIPPADLNSNVINGYAGTTSNYGGVTVWDRGYDVNSNYTGQIHQYVKTQARPSPLRRFIAKNAEYYI